jgi:hypothetical protein
MQFVQLCYLLLQFLCLTRHQLEAGQVARSVFFSLVVTKLSCSKDSLQGIVSIQQSVPMPSSLHE